jgi:membrane-associated PAP2 superfamily phosphatase
MGVIVRQRLKVGLMLGAQAARMRLPSLSLPPLSRITAVTALVLAGMLLWDHSGLDLPLARLVGGPGGFSLREDWLLTVVLHDGMRRASWLLVLGLCLAVWWPVGPLKRLDFSARLQLAATTLAAAMAVSLLKGFSDTSCPWDLAGFGGAARYLPHWTLRPDGGPGHCFPAGHASSGFAFVGGYFSFREHDARLAKVWLGTAIAAGLLLGIGQQLRGAHFMSHTLWTGWICWTVALVVDRLWPDNLAEQA